MHAALECRSALLLSYSSSPVSVCRFFFQAEDGIRDGHVTGVQTCALPISAHGQGNFNHNQCGFAKGWGIGNVGVYGGHWACPTSTDTRRGIAPGKSGPSYSNP